MIINENIKTSFISGIGVGLGIGSIRVIFIGIDTYSGKLNKRFGSSLISCIIGSSLSWMCFYYARSLKY